MGADTRRSRLVFPGVSSTVQKQGFRLFHEWLLLPERERGRNAESTESISAAGCNTEERPFQGGVAIQTRTGFSPSGRLCRTFFRPFGA